jgi:transcriptional regulator with XRE-family HTH domain
MGHGHVVRHGGYPLLIVTNRQTTDQRVTVGLRLGEYLRARPPSLAEIAREAGVSRQRVWRVVHGVQPPSERILRAALGLGVPAWVVGDGLADEEAT